jgi:hypothetical protein
MIFATTNHRENHLRLFDRIRDSPVMTGAAKHTSVPNYRLQVSWGSLTRNLHYKLG